MTSDEKQILDLAWTLWGYHYGAVGTWNPHSLKMHISDLKQASMTVKIERSKVTVYRFTDDGDLVLADGKEAPEIREDNLVSLFDFISCSRELRPSPEQVTRARLNYMRDNR